ncbi:hypothetical protein DK10_003015 [Burkholderia cenocepacia]|nr:hypothetical protein DK10_003015 [Burkholderia cenocepacia]
MAFSRVLRAADTLSDFEAINRVRAVRSINRPDRMLGRQAGDQIVRGEWADLGVVEDFAKIGDSATGCHVLASL